MRLSQFLVSLQKKVMQIVVRCTESQKEEWLSNGTQADVDVLWAFEKVDLLRFKTADAIVDLLFENTQENLNLLKQCSGLKIINSVVDTLQETDTSFIRINGWTTFLKMPVLEGNCTYEDLKKLASPVFSCFNKTIEWLPDEPGFVTPRVISMIINEAYFALAESVSTREEIDLAMKLGTAYPLGPFEWSEKIGLKNIVALLQKLNMQQSRYTPAPLLLREANAI
jgi:3-hydroxybutyryl-CoA dehydrogenase